MLARNLICVLLVIVSSDGVKERKGELRKPRLFTFNTVDDEISVMLEFSIPFVTIPSKKAVESAAAMFGQGFPSININPTSLAVGGAVVLVTTVVIPLLLRSYTLHYPHRYSRILDSTEFSTDAFLDFAGQMLSDSKSIRGCALRIACWSSQKTSTDPLIFWNQIMSNSLLSSMINATAIEDAIVSGRNGRDCATYSPCPLREDHLPVLVNNVANIANSLRSL